MNDEGKSREQLLQELNNLRERNNGLEEARAEHQGTEEDLYRMAMDATSDGYFDHNLITDEVFYGQRCEEMLGYAPGEMKHHLTSWSSLLHPSDVPEIQRRVGDLLQGNTERFECEYRFRNGTDDWRWILSRAKLVEWDESGNPTRLVGTHQDINQRKQVEEALLKEKDRANKYLDIAGVMILALDSEARVTLINRTGCEITGYEYDEVLGKDWIRLIYPSEESEELCQAYAGIMKGDIALWKHADGELITKSGTRKFLKWHNTLLLDDRGKRIGMLCSADDITERKETEEDRNRLERQLHHSQKMEAVGRLAGGVAHDFNNMLGVILGHSELAMGGLSLSDPLFDHLKEIEGAAERSAKLTGQLLAFARRQTISPRRVDLNSAAAGTLNMLRRLIGEGVDLVWKPGVDLWKVKVDPTQIDQVLTNLCVNSRDAISGVGQITIETENVHFDSATISEHPSLRIGEFVMLSVSDDGCGMEKEVLRHIFEPFFTTKRVGEGTGLGLAMVFGVVKQNEGLIRVTSDAGLGTSIRIFLPRLEESEVLAVSDGSAGYPMGKGETVLLVEDEPAILKVGKAMLDQLGYSVLTANSPKEALDLTESRAGEIQLLITDVVMPEMDGRELAGRLYGRMPDLKCLFISGYTSDVIAKHGILNEGVDFLQKPFTITGLAICVREALDSE